MRWTLTVLGLSVLILVGGGFVLLSSAGEAVGRKQQAAADRKAERQRQASAQADAESGRQAPDAEVATSKREPAVYFVTRQAVWLVVAIVFMLLATFFDYHNWRRYPFLTILLYVIIVGLMVAVLFAAKTKGSSSAC